MDPGEQTTGTRDEHYNLVSVLYHALHGAENCDIYALAAEAKDLLGIADAIPGAGDVSAGGIAGGAAAGGATLEGDVPPGAMPEDVPPTAGFPSGTAPPPPDTPPPTDVVPPDDAVPPDRGAPPPE